MSEDREFAARRRNTLHELYGVQGDRSRKGSVDAPIEDLVAAINSNLHMFTTSSCSGRISCFAEPTEVTRAQGKKGGEWVFASHDKVDPEELVSTITAAAPGGGCLVFRMEPFVMHAECCDATWSSQLLGASRQAGFRESGLVMSAKGRCMVGIRCSIRLEVPVADGGKMLVGDDYIRYLAASANRKLDLNAERHGRLLALVKALPSQLPESGGLRRGRRNRRSGRGGRQKPGYDLLCPEESLAARQKAILERLGSLEAAVGLSQAGGLLTPTPQAAKKRSRKRAHSRHARRKESADHGKTEVQGGAVLLVPRAEAKGAKDAAKAQGWMDRSRRVEEVAEGMVGLPVTPGLAAAWEEFKRPGGTAQPLPEPLGTLLVNGKAELRARGSLAPRKQPKPPAERLRDSVKRLLLQSNALDGPSADERRSALVCSLPIRWERLGDLVLLPAGALEGEEWEKATAAVRANKLWGAVAEALGAKRVARQAKVASTGTRDSQAELLLGEDGWVEHKESGVTFCLDATKCMFSSGNVTERTRMGRLKAAAGETVVDLFAGIGYYTLPLLAKAGAAKVYACEWNPHAVAALRHNLSKNGVAGRCDVLEGDCRERAPCGVADRVMLGLLPSSTCGWLTAVKSLKASGGWLHIHENVKDADEKRWVQETAAKIACLAAETGREWEVSVGHLERVKWYAPHIRHVVLDLLCQPRDTA